MLAMTIDECIPNNQLIIATVLTNKLVVLAICFAVYEGITSRIPFPLLY